MAKISPIQAVRGMNDILPPETALWQQTEALIRDLMAAYGYQEIRTPIVESTALFKRSIGEVTDIVEKEMYTFEDRNGDSLSLRPEGTAGCVRACVEHSLLYHQSQRLWYYGTMYRHERPQKGRYRQFYQLGVECLGFQAPEIDAELIMLTARLWRMLGLSQQVTLQLNSIGLLEEREAYKQVLVAYFSAHADQLDEDSQRRLHTNPLRILDSKNPTMQGLIKDAPSFAEHLGEVSRSHFEQVKAILDQAGIAYEVNPRLVRGLDYYNHTVFEWVTSALGSQGTVCAGGRYDKLVEQLGGPAVPAVGFAMGMERILALLEAQQLAAPVSVDAYMVFQGESAHTTCLLLAEKLRDTLPKLRLLCDGSGGKLANQFKRADKSGAYLALVLGEQEALAQQITIKFLREDKPQAVVAQTELTDFISTWLRTRSG